MGKRVDGVVIMARRGLVIHESTLRQLALGRGLQQQGFEVVLLSSFDDARELMATGAKFDLVIIDFGSGSRSAAFLAELHLKRGEVATLLVADEIDNDFLAAVRELKPSDMAKTPLCDEDFADVVRGIFGV